MTPNIHITHFKQAEMLLEDLNFKPPIKALISIGLAKEDPPKGYNIVPRYLRLCFNDILAEEEELIRINRPDVRAPAKEDIQKIITFAESIKDSGGTVLIHCAAGFSRSPAAAAICMRQWLGKDSEEEVAKFIFKIRPPVSPNKTMIRLADEIFCSGGKLVTAIDFRQKALMAMASRKPNFS